MSELSKWGDELKSTSKRNLLGCMNENSEGQEETGKIKAMLGMLYWGRNDRNTVGSCTCALAL